MPRHPATVGEVLRLIREEGAATRADLGRLTGLSRPAVAARVGDLIGRGLVIERSDGPSTGGRPPVRLEFNAAGGTVLVAALGHTRGHLAVCDLAGRVLVQKTVDLAADGVPRPMPYWLLEVWEELLAKTGAADASVRGVGVGIPGTVEFAAGRPQNSPPLPPWHGEPIAEVVADRFQVPVCLDNDVNVMALGEHRSGFHDVDDLLFVKLSTGIGAGVIAGGAIQRGALGAAGEIGHIPVRNGGGARCRCGNLDCIEAVAGGAALLAGRDVADLTELAVAARGGNPEFVTLVREAGRRIGEVIGAAVNLLNPAVVVLGGALAAAHEPLVAGVREVVYQRSTALATRQLRIEPSRLGDLAGITGCAALAVDRVLAPRVIDGDAAPAAPPPSS